MLAHGQGVRLWHPGLHRAGTGHGKTGIPVRCFRPRSGPLPHVLRKTSGMAVRLATGRIRAAKTTGASGPDRIYTQISGSEVKRPFPGRDRNANRLCQDKIPGAAAKGGKTQPAHPYPALADAVDQGVPEKFRQDSG